MVAEVDAAVEGTQQKVAYGRAAATRTPAARIACQCSGDDRARAEVINHGPTGHTTGSRTFQCLDHLETIVIGQPDVEQHMNVFLCGIDVVPSSRSSY